MNAIRTARAYFHRSDFAKDTAILTLGTLLAQLVGIASMPVMSRLYSPADFGQLAVFMAVVGVTGIAVTLRYEATIMLPKEESQSTNLTLLSLALALCLGVMLSVLAWVAPDEIKVWLGIHALGNWLPVAVLTGIGSAIVATGANWFNRHRAYSQIVKQRVIQSFVAVAVAVTLGYSDNASGLVTAQITALLVTSLVVMLKIRPLLQHWSMKAVVAVAREHITGPKFLLPTALLDMVTMQLPVFLITAWFSSDSAGQFSMAWRILGLPMALIGGAVGQVFFQRFSQVWPDVPAAQELLFKTWKVLLFAGLPPTVVVMVFGESLFVFVLGDAWREAGVMAAVMAPMLLAMLISSPTSSTFIILGLQRYSFLFGIAVFIYRPICIYIGFKYNNIYTSLFLFSSIEIIQIYIFQRLALSKLKKKL